MKPKSLLSRYALKWKQILPFVLLLLLILIVYLTNIHRELSLETLRSKSGQLQHYVHIHPFLSPFLFIIIYTLSVCLVLPDSTILTLFAGMSFSWPLAMLYCLISETFGALLFFGAVRFLGITLSHHEARLLHKMRLLFQKNSIYYLLFLRISHLLPFWLINFCAAYFNTSWRTFFWTTFVGLIPLTYLLVEAGHDLQIAMTLGTPFKIASIFSIQTNLALVLIGLITLLPIIFRKWKKHTSH